jgi:endonuclease-3
MIKYAMPKSKAEPNRAPAAPDAVAARTAQPPSAASAAKLIKQLAQLYPEHPLDVKGAEPFRVLVAGMLSSRTKDPVTNAAMRRLWARASTPQALLAVPEAELAALLKPVGFYMQKAKQLHGLCRTVLARFGGGVPRTREELMELPGVGRKVANLVLNVCYGFPAICVDTHVHRISNRLGWVRTQTPEETEPALELVIPRQHWSMLNRVLVNHGQQVCHPVSPKCSECAIAAHCARVGVTKNR